MAWIALGGAGAFLFYSEQQLNERRSADRAFDLHARELTDALSDVRASQQAYVAAGQAPQFWLPKVAQMAAEVQAATNELHRLSVAPQARQSLDGAIDSVAQFLDADQRARDYLRADQPLMAADVIFSEGREVAATAARQVESARLAEHQALDAFEGRIRRQQALGLAGAGGFAAIILLALGAVAPRPRQSAEPTETIETLPRPDSSTPEVSLPLKMPAAPPVASASRAIPPALAAAADLCTDFGRLTGGNDLQPLIGRVCEAMHASGVVVWLGTASGADLEPALAHGYSQEVMARMPRLARDADNAAAAAYRTGEMQVVKSPSGRSRGALVVPIVSAHGRIGALSAELRDGGESSESVQALARIVAAQLAGLLSAPPDAADEPRAASL